MFYLSNCNKSSIHFLMKWTELSLQTDNNNLFFYFNKGGIFLEGHPLMNGHWPQKPKLRENIQ